MRLLIMTCPFCGIEHTVKVNKENWFAYKNGELAQNAFPELSATKREQIVSGICPDCQKKFLEKSLLDRLFSFGGARAIGALRIFCQ